jgi:predicted enzyme related to lactoylglutathione lyase
MSVFKNVAVVALYVRNWEAAKKFYSEVLEWPVAYSSDEVGWIEYGQENEAHVAINRWDDARPIPTSGATLVFTVDDPYQVTEALRLKGVRCDDVVHIPGVVTYGTFYDPEGNRMQFAGNEPA